MKAASRSTGSYSSSHDWDNFQEASEFAPFGYRCKVPLWIPWDTTFKDDSDSKNMRVYLYVFQQLKLPPHITRESTLNEFSILEVGSNGDDFALLRKVLPDRAILLHIQDLDLGEWTYTNGKKVSFGELVPLVELPSKAASVGNNYYHQRVAPNPMGAMFGYQVYLPPAFRIPTRFMGDTGPYEAGITNYVRDQVLVAANGEPEGLDAFLLLWDSERKGFVTVVRRRSGAIFLVCRDMSSSLEAGVFRNEETGHTLCLKSDELPEMAGQEFEWSSYKKTITYGFRFNLPDLFEKGGSLSSYKSDFIRDEVLRPLEEDARHFEVIPFAKSQLWIRKEPTVNGYQLADVDNDAQVALFTPLVQQHQRPLLVQFACMAHFETFCSDQYGYRLWVPREDAQRDLNEYVKYALEGMGIRCKIWTNGKDGGDFTLVPMRNPKDYYAILRIHDNTNENNQLFSIGRLGSNYAIYNERTNGTENKVTFDRLLDLTKGPKRLRSK